MQNIKINDYILTKDGYHGSIVEIIDEFNVLFFNKKLK
jgi:preprotein translocase subunit YajC